MCRTSQSYLDDDFPFEQLLTLHKRRKEIPTRDTTPETIPSIPTGCGILLNLTLIGIFPTARWLTDPTMPPDVKELFGGTPFFALGEYRVAHLDLKDSTGTLRKLTLVINNGVPGMDLGYWGGAFSRSEPYSCLARFECTGDMETSIFENPTTASRWFEKDFDSLEFVDGIFETGMHPGVCKTQFEKLLGVATEFLLTQVDWSILPESLVEIRDMSPRLERRRARRRPHSKQSKFKSLPLTE